MIHSVPFDTLAYAKSLEAHGITVEHAEAHAQALAQVLDDRVSTKQETQDIVSKLEGSINELRKDMDTNLSNLRNDMDTKFARVYTELSATKTELIKWVLGISFTQAALMTSLLKLFP